MFGSLYLLSGSRTKPERRKYWAAHPLLSVFFSDMSGEELQIVVPGYDRMMTQAERIRVPSGA